MGVDHLGGSAGEQQKLWGQVGKLGRGTPAAATSIGRGGIRVYDGGSILLDTGDTSIELTAGDVARIKVGAYSMYGGSSSAGDFMWITGGAASVRMQPDRISLVAGTSRIDVMDDKIMVDGPKAGEAANLLGVTSSGELVLASSSPGGGGDGPVGPDGGPGAGWAWPFALSTVTSEFGPRDGRFHEGIDFGVGTGTNIRSLGPGTVETAGWHSNTGFGWYVIVNHGTVAGHTVKTVYGHMNTSPYVSVGQAVTKDTVLGPVGNTGGSFGAHLHMEVHNCPIGGGINWMNQDPSPSAPRTAVNPRDFMG